MGGGGVGRDERFNVYKGKGALLNNAKFIVKESREQRHTLQT